MGDGSRQSAGSTVSKGAGAVEAPHGIVLPARPEAKLLLGDRYQLERELARGGMGSVWVGSDRDQAQAVAVKFHAFGVDLPRSRRRFGREADALKVLSNPHVVRILDAGEDAGLAYMVMELLDGETLRQRLQARGRFKPEEVSALIQQAALGLGTAHAAGIVHRDIKPSNMFLAQTPDGECLKIIDFGIAKPAAEVDATSSGLVGSPAYMSPEQARGDRIDQRADLWSLAVVAYELLTGERPFGAGNVPATLERICSGRFPPASQLGAPAGLDRFFRRAFEIDPSLRYQTTDQFALAFEQARQGELNPGAGRIDDTRTVDADAGRRRRPSPRRSAVFGAALAVLALLTAIAVSAPLRMSGAPSISTTATRPQAAPGVVEPIPPPLTAVLPSVLPRLEIASGRPTQVRPRRSETARESQPSAATTASSAAEVLNDRGSALPLEEAGKADDPLDRRF